MIRKTSIILLIMALLIVPSIGFTEVKINPEKIYNLGVEAFESHNYDKAISLMEKAIKSGLEGNKADNAREVIKKSNKNKFVSNKKDADLLDIAFYLVDSVSASDDGLRRVKADRELRVAKYLISVNNNRKARDLTSDALKLASEIQAPSYRFLKADIKANAAAALYCMGDKKQSSEVLNSIKDDAIYHRDSANKEIAILLAKKGKYSEAREIINNIQGTLNKAQAYTGIATYLLKSGKDGEALNYINKAIEVNNSQNISDEKGRAYALIAVGLKKMGKTSEYEFNMARAYDVFKDLPESYDSRHKASLLAYIMAIYYNIGGDNYRGKIIELIPQLKHSTDAISSSYEVEKELSYADLAAMHYVIGLKDEANNIVNSFTGNRQRLKSEALQKVVGSLAVREQYAAGLDLAKTIETPLEKNRALLYVIAIQMDKDHLDQVLNTIDLLDYNYKENEIFELVISALNKANTKQQKQLASQIMDRLR
jgi:tetratricopeptide (TPR) repeat protein